VVSMTTVRDHLRTFMAEHVEGLPAEDEWALVALAEKLELPEMAQLQAHQVLLADPDHQLAHEYLGHKLLSQEYKWPSGKRWLNAEEFGESISDWSDRFVLESEHYVVETNTSVAAAVNLLFDLEFVYLHWMDNLGPDLNAGEDVLDKSGHKMTWYIYTDRDDKAFTDYYNGEREAHYDPSTSVTTQRGNPNVVFTFFGPADRDRPSQFFDLAVQQLMYSTLVLSRKSGYLPPDPRARNAHWAELGMGYWLGRQFTGSLGYARTMEFRPEPRTRQLANTVMHTGRLSKRLVRKEITNLINLEHLSFYMIDKAGTAQIYRAKARNLFRFLIEENPPVVHGKKIVGWGREALFFYLREAYIKPAGHSTSSFDKGLGGAKIEDLYDSWVQWRVK